MSIISRFNSLSYWEELKNDSIFLDEEPFTIEPGPFQPTMHELQWLHSFLNNEEADALLSEKTKEKLQALLKEIPPMNKEDRILLKQMPQPENNAAPFLRDLKKWMREHRACILTYTTKAGKTFTEEGYPFEIVYNIAKKRWYLKWVNQNKWNMITPLDRLEHVSVSDADIQEYIEAIEFDEPKSAVIQWTPQFENMDVHRFLHAFSAFHINVLENEPLRMEIQYIADEEPFLLSKIRQFGPHVWIQSPPSLQEAMIETAKRALENYL